MTSLLDTATYTEFIASSKQFDTRAAYPSCPCVIQIEASIQELAQEGMEVRLAAAQAGRDQSQAASEEAGAAVEAAERELAGAQAGDGRDESNKSLQERLAEAQNAQARLLPKGCLSQGTSLRPP